MNEGRYNLRSNRGECCISMQLQLALDAGVFFMALGDRADSSQTGQVGSTDLSDSRSNINIDALIEHSDQNLSPKTFLIIRFKRLTKVRPHRPRVRIIIRWIRTTLIAKFWHCLVHWGRGWIAWKVQ